MKERMVVSGAGVIVFFMMVILASCKNEDKNLVDDPDSIYFDYKITGREGNDKMTIQAQYLAGGNQGDALRIPGTGKVELDGQPFLPDSAGIGGFYYELHLPIDSFDGPHKIRFTDHRNQIYTEDFTWRTPRLISGPPDTIGLEDLFFEFSGLDSVARVRVMVTDTSFSNNETNQVVALKNNKHVIPAQSLVELASGPVQVEFILEKNRPLKSRNPGGGRFQIYYSMTREYWLRSL